MKNRTKGVPWGDETLYEGRQYSYVCCCVGRWIRRNHQFCTKGHFVGGGVSTRFSTLMPFQSIEMWRLPHYDIYFCRDNYMIIYFNGDWLARYSRNSISTNRLLRIRVSLWISFAMALSASDNWWAYFRVRFSSWIRSWVIFFWVALWLWSSGCLSSWQHILVCIYGLEEFNTHILCTVSSLFSHLLCLLVFISFYFFTFYPPETLFSYPYQLYAIS